MIQINKVPGNDKLLDVGIRTQQVIETSNTTEQATLLTHVRTDQYNIHLCKFSTLLIIKLLFNSSLHGQNLKISISFLNNILKDYIFKSPSNLQSLCQKKHLSVEPGCLPHRTFNNLIVKITTESNENKPSLQNFIYDFTMVDNAYFNF